jgi:hypothetical protein
MILRKFPLQECPEETGDRRCGSFSRITTIAVPSPIGACFTVGIPESLPTAHVTAAPAGRTRLESVDVVRGVIMMLMALDHVNDFFRIPGVNPTDIAKTTAALFRCRWCT